MRDTHLRNLFFVVENIGGMTVEQAAKMSVSELNHWIAHISLKRKEARG